MYIAASELRRLFEKFFMQSVAYQPVYQTFNVQTNFRCTVSCTMKNAVVLLRAVTAGFDLITTNSKVGKVSYAEV